MCTQRQILDIARGGYYAQAIEDQQLLKSIHDAYKASGEIYSSRRVWNDLREVSEACSKN